MNTISSTQAQQDFRAQFQPELVRPELVELAYNRSYQIARREQAQAIAQLLRAVKQWWKRDKCTSPISHSASSA